MAVVALVEDRPGVLNRVASLFRRRGFNIDSLAVGTTEEQGISRMTIVVDGVDGIVEQVEKQLYKLIDVVKVSDVTHEEAVIRELVLIKVRCTKEQRRDVLDLIAIFRAQAVDVSPTSMIVQSVADQDRNDGQEGEDEHQPRGRRGDVEEPFCIHDGHLDVSVCNIQAGPAADPRRAKCTGRHQIPNSPLTLAVTDAKIEGAAEPRVTRKTANSGAVCGGVGCQSTIGAAVNPSSGMVTTRPV